MKLLFSNVFAESFMLLYALIYDLRYSYWLWWHCFIGHQMEETLRAAGKHQLFTCLSYPGAGHLIEPPYTPNSRASLWSVKPVKREPRPRFITCCPYISNMRLFIVMLNINCHGALSFFCRDHSVGRSSCIPRCCPGRRLEEDPGISGN